MGIFSKIKLLFKSKKPEKPIEKRDILAEQWESAAHLLEIDEDTIQVDKIETIETQTPKEPKESSGQDTSGRPFDKVTDAVLDTGEKFMEKSKEFMDGPGRKVAEKFGEASEKIGEKIVKGGKAVYEKASEALNDLGEKLDEKIKEAEEFAKTEKESKGEFADTDFRVKDTKSHDDFFSKADKFSRGDFSDFPETKIIPPEKEGKKSRSEIEGFDDRDMDGDPLIDEADIVEEE